MKITFQLCIAMIFLCQACSKDSTLEEKNWDAYNPITTRSITPHTNPYIDWEDTTLINISGHRTVTLPWYNGASGAIPTYITQDYKRADGWELVYNFCSDTIENDGRKNYLIFYNKLTGKLRVFYYNRDIVTDGSATIAQFITSDPTRLFYFNEGYFSSPLNMGNSFCEVQTSNISSSETKATTLGWNCFEIELAYDPYIEDQNLSVSFFDQNIAKILLSGILEAKTDGTIISTSVSNPLKPLVNLVGNTAGDAIQNAYEKGVKNKKTGGNTRSKFGELLGSVGSNMVSSGLNLLFGSFLGEIRSDERTAKHGRVKNQRNDPIHREYSEKRSFGNSIYPKPTVARSRTRPQ